MLESAGKINHLSFTYEKVNKTDSLQPPGCIGLLVLKKFFGTNRKKLTYEKNVFLVIRKDTLNNTRSHDKKKSQTTIHRNITTEY